MTVEFQIEKNDTRKPYIVKTWKGNELVSEKPARILAYYDVKILRTGKLSIFDITKLDNADGEMLDYDDSLYDNLSELGIEKNQIELMIGKIIDKVQQMYFDGKLKENLELEVK
ncbi:hypothetical protein [Pontibacter lucknowensis]|uniref:Uncharacterized protein n=1 Tax=Pontibacter lucknowensis TaxID=1077936 RepID=A0A1N6ZJ93_9BACT|nr:hypothetical protein [Pontibacter lucknowensis]SIR26857.1 hypothetical protein SAMN05421545_3022 [Pontibacter lucknowensis]